MSYYQVVPECYADTILVEILGFAKPNHQLGIGKVLANLEKFSPQRAIVGIIDDDKEKPKLLDTFEQIGEVSSIKRYIRASHSVLILCPAFEDWVYQNAAIVDVDPAKFGFKNKKAFREASKRLDVRNDQRIKQFLNTLCQKKAPGFLQLKTWICEAIGISESEIYGC